MTPITHTSIVNDLFTIYREVAPATLVGVSRLTDGRVPG